MNQRDVLQQVNLADQCGPRRSEGGGSDLVMHLAAEAWMFDRGPWGVHRKQCDRHLQPAAGGEHVDVGGERQTMRHHISTDEVFGSLGSRSFRTPL